jgi:hypothetical protein
MLRFRPTAILFLAGFQLFGQSQAETTDYILREFRACDNEQLEIKDVKFIDNDATFKLTTAIPGYLTEQTIEFPVAEMDVFTRTTLLRSGPDEQVYVYSLMVAPRGRSGGLRRNLARTAWPEALLRNHPNGRLVQGLERAFGRLAELVGGRRQLFQGPPDR